MELYDKMSFAIQMFFILIPFTLRFDRRNHFTGRMAVCTAAVLCAGGAWNLGGGSLLMILRYITILFLLFLLLDICYEEKRSAKLFALTASYSVQTILYSVYKISVYFIDMLPRGLGSGILQLFSGAFIFIGGFVFCFRFFPRRMDEKHNVNLDNRIMLVLTLCIILVSNIFNILMLKMGLPQYAFTFIFEPMKMVPSILLLCLQFNLVSNQALLLERNTLERLLKEKDAQYQMSKENIELIQMKCHDLKYQIKALKNSNYVDRDALKEIEKNVDIYDGIVKTGNEALDVILTEKSLLCEKHKIKITVMLDGSRLNHINVSDLYCIFGNAIDNAIEAVEKEQDEENRLISITSRSVGNLFSIRIANYYSGELVLENGMPVTSKEDKRFHGFGLKSIAYIVEKHGGNMAVHKEDHLFVLNILLPLK